MRHYTPPIIPDYGPLDEYGFNKRGIPEIRYKQDETGKIIQVKLLHPVKDYKEMCLLYALNGDFGSTTKGWIKFLERKYEDNPDEPRWLEKLLKLNNKHPEGNR